MPMLLHHNSGATVVKAESRPGPQGGYGFLCYGGGGFQPSPPTTVGFLDDSWALPLDIATYR
jgi:hypothetical protein